MLKSFSNRKKRVNRINVAKRHWGGEVKFSHLTFDLFPYFQLVKGWSPSPFMDRHNRATYRGLRWVSSMFSQLLRLTLTVFEEWSLMRIFAKLPPCDIAGKLGCSPPSLPWLDPPPLCRPQEPWCLHHGPADRPWERPCLRPLHRPGAPGLETGRQEWDALAVPSTSRQSGRCKETLV